MYFWNSYPFVRLSFAFIIGIKLYDIYPFLWDSYILTLSFLAFLIGTLQLISAKKGFYQLRHANGIALLLTIILLGGLNTKYQYHSYSDNHYSHLMGKIRGFSGIIVSPVNERKNHFRYDLNLEETFLKDSTHVTEGLIHLYVKKDTSQYLPYEYGDKILVYGSFYPIPGPGNPSEFDYRNYLQKQHIQGHAFIEKRNIKFVGNTPLNPLLRLAFRLRIKASRIIESNIDGDREKAVIKALLLGIKDHLDNDVKRAYSAAGAMHVLAVSGLHVGIIFLLIQQLIGKLRDQGPRGKLVFGIISVTLIWIYAIMTGLSPSVLRAATMFSIVSIGQSNSREGNIYNTLGFAAFLLLCFDPYLIYSVGFQLSFIAVLGIVYLQPILYRLFYFRVIILDKIWSITCVSIAAQIATFPLSAYYFHQFPTYFLVSNLIVIPAAFLLLLGGISMLIIDSVSSYISELLGYVISKFMWMINESITHIEMLPHSLLEWIYLDQCGLFLTYSIILTLIAGLHYKSFKTVIISFLLGFMFIGWSIHSNQIQVQSHELVFYEIKGNTVIDHIFGHEAVLYIDDYNSANLELLSYQIDPFRLSSHLQPVETSIKLISENTESVSSLRFGEIGGQKLIIFDSTTFHLNFDSKIYSNIILIENGSVKSLTWLSENFDTQKIIIGNNNSTYYINKISKQAKALGVEIHVLKRDGALRMDIKKERTIQPALFTTNPD